MLLKICGALMIAFASFVGFLHGFLAVQGKRDPESLGRYHDWPVIGGFFPKYEAPPPEPTEDELKLEKAAIRLAQSRAEYRLPPPYDADELKKLVDELAEAKAKNDRDRRALDEERERMKRAETDLAERQAVVAKAVEDVETKAKALIAQAEELERERLFVRSEESKNLKRLALVYESMAPADAAKKLGDLDADTTAKLVAVMTERKAGKILGAMDTPRAVEITKRIQARASADAKR
jgi:flagellar motility protein MotE (MotC chaperone)